MTPVQQEYDELVSSIEPKRPILTNCIRAFLVGGAICTIGQGLQWIFMNYFIFDEKTSYNYSFDYIVTGNKLKLNYGGNSITLKKLKNV